MDNPNFQPINFDKNQTERFNELVMYLREQREKNRDNKLIKDICTNSLAWLILIEKSQ